MESQENKPQDGSHTGTGTPTKTITPNHSKENIAGRLTGESFNQRETDRHLPPRMSSEEFHSLSQQVRNISLEEAKDHLQNLGPVPAFPDPVEMNNRKLLDEEEKKTIRRDAVSFLKRRTAERQAKLDAQVQTPTLTITNEGAKTSPLPSTIPLNSAPAAMAPQTFGSTSGNMAASPGTDQFNRGQNIPARGAPVTEYTAPAGNRYPALAPREQQNFNSHHQGNQRIASNLPLSSSTGPAASAFPTRFSSMAQPLAYSGVRGRGQAPVQSTGWVSNPYASNDGTPPASAARAVTADPWQNHGLGLPIPPVVPSQNQPVTRNELENKKLKSNDTGAGDSSASPQQ